MPYFGCLYTKAECTPAVTPSVNSRDQLRVQRVLERVGDDDAVLAVAAPSRVKHEDTCRPPSSSRRSRAACSTTIESTMTGLAGLLMSIAYARSPPPCEPR